MSTFILLSALPGSGKSTWAKRYAEEHPNTKIISSDGLREEFFGSPNVFQDEKLIWGTFEKRIEEYASDKTVTVIADATMLTNHYRLYYRKKAEAYDKKIIVLFDIPYEICKIQNEMRAPNKIVPIDAMERLKKEYEEPSQKVLDQYDEVIKVTKRFISPEAMKKGLNE